MRTVVVASVGTDHHPFDRLMDWLEAWGGAPRVDLRVQHGTSRQVPGAHNVAFLPHDELLGWMREADCIVLQGGPGGILDALRCGLRPIVVPRTASLGEVVDDHQFAFAALMSARGLVQVVDSAAELGRALDRVGPRTGPAIDLSEALESRGPQRVAELLATPPPRIPVAQRRERLRQLLGRTGTPG